MYDIFIVEFYIYHVYHTDMWRAKHLGSDQLIIRGGVSEIFFSRQNWREIFFLQYDMSYIGFFRRAIM